MKTFLTDLAQAYSGLASVVVIITVLAALAWACDEYDRWKKNRHL